MSNVYLGIASASKNNLQLPHPDQIASYEEYVATCQAMVNHILEISETAQDSCSKGIEYQTFGVSGHAGGNAIAPMLWNIGCFPQMMCRLTNAQTGLIMTSFNEVIDVSCCLNTVYTANLLSHGVYNEVTTDAPISNIVNLSWNDLRTSIPQVDYAQVAIWHFIDEDLIQPIIDSVKVGGVLVLSNASNGGELYRTEYIQTFSQQVHDRITRDGQFHAMHLQGYTSFTVFLKVA